MQEQQEEKYKMCKCGLFIEDDQKYCEDCLIDMDNNDETGAYNKEHYDKYYEERYFYPNEDVVK